MTESIPEDRRREIFAALVAAQDSGLSVAASREKAAAAHQVDAATVKAIEAEGMKNEWPPLGD